MAFWKELASAAEPDLEGAPITTLYGGDGLVYKVVEDPQGESQ